MEKISRKAFMDAMDGKRVSLIHYHTVYHACMRL